MRTRHITASWMLLLCAIAFGPSAVAQSPAPVCTDRSSTTKVVCFTVATTTVDTYQQLQIVAWSEGRDNLNTTQWTRYPADIQIREGSHTIIGGGTNSLNYELYTDYLPEFSVLGVHQIYAYESGWASSPTISITVNKFTPRFALSISSTVSRTGGSVQLKHDSELHKPTGTLVYYVRPPGGSLTEYARKSVSWPLNHIIDYDTRTFTFAPPYDVSGQYGFAVGYLGDALNAAKTSQEITVLVGPFVTSTALAQSTTLSLTSKPVVLTATVSGARAGVPLPSGNVEFYDGTKLLGTASLSGQGTAEFTTTQLAGTGAHSLTARYAGDFNYQASTSAAITHDIKFDPSLLVPILNLLMSN